MRLGALSRASTAACLAGLAVLAGVAYHTLAELEERQQALAELVALEYELAEIAGASQMLLLYGRQPASWRVYQERSAALSERLAALGQRFPAARKVARQVAVLRESLELVPAQAQAGAGAGPARGPLGLSPGQRLQIGNLQNHVSAMQAALSDTMAAQQRRVAADSRRLALGFAGAAALFGVLCAAAFLLIHLRIGRPVQAFAGAIARLRAGDPRATVAVEGRDELGELAQAFNALVEDQRGAHAALRAQQAELEHRDRMHAESQRIAGLGSWRLHLADRRIEWSAQTYRITGRDPRTFDPDEASFDALIHPEDRERVAARRARAIRNGERYDLQLRICRPDGEIRHVHARAEPVLDAGGQVVLLEGTLQDVTERVRLEERIAHYQQLIEGSEELYAIGDAEYRYVLVNPAYARRYGRRPEDCAGLPIADVVGADVFAREIKAGYDRCLAGAREVFESKRHLPEGGRVELLVRHYPLRSAGGEPLVAAVITDITAFKRTERELAERREILEIAGRMAQLGGWSITPGSGRVLWSDVTAELHGMPAGHAPGMNEALAFFTAASRGTVRGALEACAEQGEAFDLEAEIVTAAGARRSVRMAGKRIEDSAGQPLRLQGAMQDITETKAAERERVRLAQRLGAVLDNLSDAFVTLDWEGRISYANAPATRLFQNELDELTGSQPWRALRRFGAPEAERELRRALRDRAAVEVQCRYAPEEGWLEIRAFPGPDGLAVFFHDSTARQRMLERLEAQEETLRASRDQLAETLASRQALINALPAHIALLAPSGVVLDVNAQWRHFGAENAFDDPGFGVGANYLAVCEAAGGECAEQAGEMAAGLRQVLAGERESFALEYPCHSPERQRWFRAMASRLGGNGDAGTEYGAVVMHVDITERKLAEQELDRLAYEDALTRLPSRNGFVRALRARLDGQGWAPQGMVAVLDLQRLFEVNDTYGYEAGDRLLAAVAGRLAALGEHGVLAGRTGGDEFVLFLPAGEHRAAASGAFATPFDLGRLALECSARFGYTVLGESVRGVEDLLREAEIALQHGEAANGDGLWQRYSADLDDAVHERMQMTLELRQALEEQQFQLHYQPKVELATGRLVAAEALLRWQHPERGLQPPGLFIPVAEQSQLIGPIGVWALNEACRHLAAWQRAGLSIVRVAVNVSLDQFILGDFTQTVREALARHGVPPEALTLEITESVFERESDTLHRQLMALHTLGVQLSLDDFGTGYSSLLYLQRYPFDEIKIDQGFVRRIRDDAYSRKIVETVIGLAGALEATVVAEGIEEPAIGALLLQMGCRIGQGYYYSVPLAAEDFRWLLDMNVPLPAAGPSAAAGSERQ